MLLEQLWPILLFPQPVHMLLNHEHQSFIGPLCQTIRLLVVTRRHPVFNVILFEKVLRQPLLERRPLISR